MIGKLFGFVFKAIVTFVVVVALVVGAIVFVLTKLSAPAAAPAPVLAAAPAPASVQWGLNFALSAGNPPPATLVVPPVVLTPPVPTPTPPPTPIGRQLVRVAAYDHCCGETTVAVPIDLQIDNGNLYAWEYRDGVPYQEFVAGPGVTGIVNATSGWDPNNGGYWTPFFMVTYTDQNGIVTTGKMNTRSMFGR
ncbi:MAG: hypothetical protein Q8N65_00015 [bacterium]|nr:hypothetical protein [bacterium]